MKLIVELPWPCRALSLNGRMHPKAKAGYVAVARRDGKVLTLEKLGEMRGVFSPADRIRVKAVFCPPDNRGRDLFDNMPASLKPAMDGVFDALGLNDKQIRRVVLAWGEVGKPGKVVVTIGA